MSDPAELALRALRHRDRTRHQLDRRLEQAGVTPDERAAALDRLTETGLLSDDRFAEERARSLSRRGASDALIRRDLRREGVDHRAVEHAIGQLDSEDERAALLYERRGGGPRALRYLAGKGFSSETLERLSGVNALE